MAFESSGHSGKGILQAGMVCVATILFLTVAVAEEDEPLAATIPDAAALEAADAVVGEIVLERSNIFDTEKEEENRRLFRWANKLHIMTRPSVIRRQLLFKTGDEYSERLLQESERVLRETEYLYDAEIRPIRYEEGHVDIEVRTRETWTLQGGIGFGRSGGKNDYHVGLQDENFLGTGKDLLVRYTSNVDRTAMLYRYKDPALFGTRSRMVLLYSDNDDGLMRGFSLERPFYSLDTRWSAGGSVASSEQEDRLYTQGEVRDVIGHDAKSFNVLAAFSKGLRDGHATRYGLGFAYQQDLFRAVPGTVGTLPENRTLAYPYLRIEWVDDGFREMHNLNQIGPTEDINFGHQASLHLGWSSPTFGGDRNRIVFGAAFRAWRNPGLRSLLQLRAIADGRLASGPENILAATEARYFLREVARGTFHASLSLAFAHALDGERQLVLGGDSGLRGYPLRYAEGDRRYLITVEQRWYTGWHPLRLARVGAAIFCDVGEAWFAAEGRGAGLGRLTDLGFGLRVSSSRSSSLSMVHIDLAFPLGADNSIDSVQFLVNTRERF